jgi:hypothetical protein
MSIQAERTGLLEPLTRFATNFQKGPNRQAVARKIRNRAMLVAEIFDKIEKRTCFPNEQSLALNFGQRIDHVVAEQHTTYSSEHTGGLRAPQNNTQHTGGLIAPQNNTTYWWAHGFSDNCCSEEL